MNLSNRIFQLSIWLVFSVTFASAAPSMPLLKGLSWIYEGHVEWTNDRNLIEKKNIRLTMEIMDVFTFPQTRVAVVRGFPAELSWYDENTHPSYSLLVVTPENIYHLRADSKNAANRLARRLSSKTNLKKQLAFADTIFSFPLSKCKSSGFSIKGVDSRRKLNCLESVYRTNPDIEIIDFVDGLGITHYYYNHFGTTSTADVELKEVRFPGKRNLRAAK